MGIIADDNWEIVQLKTLCDIQNGFAFKSKDYTDEGARVIRIGNVQSGVIVDKHPKFIKLKEELNRFALNEGDILVSLTGDVGRVGVIHSDLLPAVLNQRVGRFCNIDVSKIDKSYLFYCLNSTTFENIVISGASGAAQKNTSTQKIKNIKIPLPPLAEQKRLVSLIDELFEKLEKAKENTEKNFNNSKELFEKYLDSIISNPQKDWKHLKLSDVITHVEYGSSKKSHKEGKVPVLGMGNIQNGRFEWDRLKYTNNEPEIKKYSLKYNDVLFNRTNSPELVGKTAIYKGEMPSIFAGYLIRIHRNEDLLDGDYLNYYLNSSFAINYGRSVMTSSVNQANINGSKLKNYPIVVPPLKEQQKIVNKLNDLSIQTKRLESIYKQKLANLDELKQSILHQTFTGRI